MHLASLAGIGRSAALEIARHVAERKRVYQRSNAARFSEDPQVLQVGRIRGAAYSAGAIVLKAAEALQTAYDANLSGDEEHIASANRDAELEVSQSVTVVSNLIWMRPLSSSMRLARLQQNAAMVLIVTGETPAR